MQTAKMNRLARLERAIRPDRRTFLVWVDADETTAEVADQVKTARQALDMNEGDSLLLLSWLPATDR